MLARFALDALRVAVLFSAALLAVSLLRRSPASTRRMILALAFAFALAVPVMSAVAPAWRVQTPAAMLTPMVARVADPLSGDAPVALRARASTSDVPSPAPARAPSASRPWAVIVAAVWAIGALLVAARLLAGMLASRRMVLRARPAPSAIWERATARARHATGIEARVRETSALDAPAVTGIFSPVVLVPASSASWSEERRFVVLLHELAHVEQADCLVYLIAQLACAVHWFNPLVWIARRRLRLERELAADDAVIRRGARPSVYAEDLMAIAAGTHWARSVPAGALGMAQRPELVTRIAAIVSASRPRRSLTPARTTALATCASAVTILLACATPDGADHRPVPTASPVKTAAATTKASSVDPRIQKLAEEELDRTMAQWQAAAGTVLVLDPKTGEILANAGQASGHAEDIAIGRAFVTGSTMKAITLAAALDEGAVTTTDSFDCGHGSRAYGSELLRDAGSYGALPLPEILAVSSNVGFSRVFDRLGGQRFSLWLRRFHLGVVPPVDGAVAGSIPASVEDGTLAGAVAAIGQTVLASPLQVAAAYAAIANDGVYLAPTSTRRAPGDTHGETLMKPATARAVSAMLEGVVLGDRATGKQARVEGVRVAGKTGTAEWRTADGKETSYASFVGFFPADHPRFVILVGVEAPRDGESGGTVAAPVFARLASRL